MTSDADLEPLHLALASVAQICINETLIEEAEILHTFLDSISAAPRFLGLLNLWIQAQRGDMREALRNCRTLAESNPDSTEITALLALLSYVGKDPMWRSVCEGLLSRPDCPEDSRRLAGSLLDGTFGRKKSDSPDAAAAATPSPEHAESVSAFTMGSFMRA